MEPTLILMPGRHLRVEDHDSQSEGPAPAGMCQVGLVLSDLHTVFPREAGNFEFFSDQIY